jgi:hypothetical protein
MRRGASVDLTVNLSNGREVDLHDWIERTEEIKDVIARATDRWPTWTSMVIVLTNPDGTEEK